jgi:ApeA N-terminal domain 1
LSNPFLWNDAGGGPERSAGACPIGTASEGLKRAYAFHIDPDSLVVEEMKLIDFEEWFAVRTGHEDDDHWPSRLSFSAEEGIAINAVRFLDDPAEIGGATFNADTLTGWLDYQRPTTVVRPRLKSSGGFAFGPNTPAMRVSCTAVAEAIIKNVFLTAIEEPIFAGLAVEHPAVHAWLNPGLVNHEWVRVEGVNHPNLTVQVLPPRQRALILSDGTRVTISTATRAPRGDALSISDYSVLEMDFPAPVNYDAITRMAWRISTLFEFMIDSRVESPVIQMPTTHTTTWNGEQTPIVAELWYRPSESRRSKRSTPDDYERLTTEGSVSVTLEALLERMIGGSDELIHFAGTIQSSGNFEQTIHHGYGELLGGLEEFDRQHFGQDRDPNFRVNMRRLAAIVREHGSEDDQRLFERVRGSASNGYSLARRLERLFEPWHEDGFRGEPNLGRIRDLRNIIPHGRGLELSSDAAQDMVAYTTLLSAVGRYHVLRALGCTGDEVANAFMRLPHKYGFLVPDRFVPERPGAGEAVPDRE